MRRVSWVRRLGATRRGLAGALGFTRCDQQGFALLVAAQGKIFPPFGEFDRCFADIGAKPQEVESGAKSHLLDQRESGIGLAALEARLHHPDLAHVSAELAAARDVADARGKHRVHRLLQRRHGGLACSPALLPACQHVVPQQARQQKTGRHRFAFTNTAVGVHQRLADELLFLGMFLRRAVSLGEHRVEHRENAAMQVLALELGDAGQRMTGLQQLDHLVEHA